MEPVEALLLGLVQGTIEWLPLSSQGQVMALAIALGENAKEALRLAVFLHIGTFFAALYYFRREAAKILKGKDRALGKFLLIALLSTAITGIPMYLLLETAVGEFHPAGVLLLIGALLVVMGIIQRKKKFVKKTSLGNKNAFFLGLGQGLAVLPGISRSGMTTSTLLFEGFEPEQAFRISFLLSIPSILVMDVLYGMREGFPAGAEALLGVLVAAVVGFVSISLLLRAAKKINFSKFCIGFGIVYGILSLVYFL